MKDDLVICEECVCCPDRGGTAIAPWALARIDWHIWDLLSLLLLTLFLIICEQFGGGGDEEDDAAAVTLMSTGPLVDKISLPSLPTPIIL